ncbi:hypothetical protein ACFL20_07920 [Spirochaetota bacterium]
MMTASLENSTLGIDKIDNTILTEWNQLSSAHSSINASDPRPIQINSAFLTMPGSRESETPDIFTKEVHCKLKSLDSIEAVLLVDINASEGTCRSVNEAAMNWALSQLTEEELERYNSEGKKLVFADDFDLSTGPNWYGKCSDYDNNNGVYSLTSPSLVVDYNESDDSYIIGTHYCKLLSPTQALYWLLHRSFLDNPIGTFGDETSLLCDTCELKDTVPVGSCIFYFETSDQRFCEDYTGSDWTSQSTIDKCNSRIEGNYSTSQCFDRSSETSLLDGDGTYRGTCAINACLSGEYLWRVYSEPAPELGMTPEEACFTGWYPAE